MTCPTSATCATCTHSAVILGPAPRYVERFVCVRDKAPRGVMRWWRACGDYLREPGAEGDL